MKKGLWFAALCMAFLLAFGSLGASQTARCQQVRRSFARSRAEMTVLASRFDAGERTTFDAGDLQGVQRITVHANPAWLEFQMGAFGLVPSSVYYGVYYSPADVPMQVDLGGGDNRWHTQRICENWYYYEASY